MDKTDEMMGKIHDMLPGFAQPYTETLVGAGLGALAGRYLLKKKTGLGALAGAAAGYFFFQKKHHEVVSGYFTGDSVTQFPTNQMGFVSPYQQPALDQYAVQPDFGEEVIEEVAPEWHRRDWRRGSWRSLGHTGRGWRR